MKRYEYSVLEKCESLHMVATGASGPGGPVSFDYWASYVEDYGALMGRLAEWQNPSGMYDELVRALVRQATTEFRDWFALSFGSDDPAAFAKERAKAGAVARFGAESA